MEKDEDVQSEMEDDEIESEGFKPQINKTPGSAAGRGRGRGGSKTRGGGRLGFTPMKRGAEGAAGGHSGKKGKGKAAEEEEDDEVGEDEVEVVEEEKAPAGPPEGAKTWQSSDGEMVWIVSSDHNTITMSNGKVIDSAGQPADTVVSILENLKML